jgi:hypothetical protein
MNKQHGNLVCNPPRSGGRPRIPCRGTIDSFIADDAIVAAYRTGPIMLRASVLRLIGWAADAGEVWLVMQALGQPLPSA